LKTSIEDLNCWKCHRIIDCLKVICSTIQPVEFENYFDYLGMHPHFDVDISLLKKNFHRLQSNVHPDKFSNSSQVCSNSVQYIITLTFVPRASYKIRDISDHTKGEENAKSKHF
uniref:J domain-containing protein n=1 Tax=Thelazia callipaeda TaxID=103827 RepID=A0A0N5CWU6_THECL